MVYSPVQLSFINLYRLSEDDEPVEIKKVINRIGRDFSVKRTRKVHLFEGIPYIQYGSLIRKGTSANLTPLILH